MNKHTLAILTLLGAMVFLGVLLIPAMREKYLELTFDFSHQNTRVNSQEEIEKILRSYPTLSFSELNNPYKEWTKSNEDKYKNILKNSQYRLIHQEDFFKKLVGDFRIKDFVCRDSVYRKCLFKKEKDYYWLIDENLPIAVLKLQHSLEEKGYNADGFGIRSAHRHPKKNEEVKGAGSSKHIKGQAIDMIIGDIDKDGKYTQKDKEIVLEICEKEVIGI
ncbi:MAG: D-Ala-D-Ala carboxypeptidase family metallohydrolase [Chitinophagales bacterium]|nr:hypothetical protein [Bacteroidota bacterium]MCB9044013.1 hypothetical protein [Chitinophagales bacterium]